MNACDVDCELGDWVRWADGPCSQECGGGFEVLRRVESVVKVGNGMPCAAWADPTRVRYQPCNTHACATNFCRSKEGEDYKGECSEHCGGGTRLVYREVTRKEFTEHITHDPCFHPTYEPCNRQRCKEFEVFPASRGIPRVERAKLGEWFKVTIIFQNQNHWRNATLKAPKGFEIGRVSVSGADEEHRRLPEDIQFSEDVDYAGAEGEDCFLTEHNLPRLEACKVGSDGQAAQFDFRNVLEPVRKGKYQVVLWVKHPDSCETDSGSGTCMDLKWELTGLGSKPRVEEKKEIASYPIETSVHPLASRTAGVMKNRKMGASLSKPKD